MDEKPKSIWQKSWQAWKKMHWFRRWLILTITFLFFRLAVIQFNPNWHGMTPNWLSELAVNSSLCGFAAGAFVCLWSFACWFANWRRCKRLLFFLACFATLIALFYAEEDWRGWHAWNQFKHEWEAKGEKFDFKDFVPPPVPDDQNFAMAPIWVESIKATLGPERSRQWFGNDYAENGRTNFTDRLALNVWRNNDWGNEPTNGYWAKGTVTELESWQAYYRMPAQTNRNGTITANEFPIAAQPQTPAQDVLLALSKYGPAVEELRAAAKLPASRFPLEYDKDDPAAILLPHLAAMKRCSQLLQLRAIAELQNGESEKAFDDVKLSLRLADAIRTEPFIITHLVRLAILQITLQPVWEGLAEHRWSDAQLAALDAELAKLDFLADYEFTVRSEPAFHIRLIDYLEQKRSRYQEFVALFSSNNQNDADVLNNLTATAIFYLAPKGWFDQNKITMVQMRQKWDAPVADAAQQTVSPKLVFASEAAQSKTSHSPFNFFARLEGFLNGYAEKVARGQASVNLARTAIALERYRLAHGEYPESLVALAPQFIAQVPHDVIGGGPLKYRRTADGQFVLYSIGWNEIDDGGVVITQKSRDPRDESGNNVDIYQGDWVWRYPAKAE
jgi:hypothetical protein